eukprot:1403861-Amphidinium_carterae.5
MHALAAARQRVKGKHFGKALIPFAEVVMWHCGGPSRYEGRWDHGIFLGVYAKNERVDRVKLDQVSGRLWKLDPSGLQLEPNVILGEVPPMELPILDSGMSIKKRVYIRRDQELLEHGFTEGCIGCNAARLGLPPRPHTEECRQRIEQAMAATEKGRQRLAEAAARVVGGSELRGDDSDGIPGLGPSSMEVSADSGRQEREKRSRDEEAEAEREVKTRLAAALSKIGCGTIHACTHHDVRAADICPRLLDVRGLEQPPELSDEQLKPVEVVMMNGFTERGVERAMWMASWAR